MELNIEDCVEGAEVKVDKAHGENLASRGVVEIIEADAPPEKKPEIKAVPAKPEVSQAKPPAVAGGTDKPKSSKAGK